MQAFFAGLGAGLLVGAVGGVVGVFLYLNGAGSALAESILKQHNKIDADAQAEQNNLAIALKETENRVRKAQTADEVNKQLENFR